LTTAGIGVITSRACCSCRWKNAAEHHRLARVEAAALGRGLDYLPEVRRGVLLPEVARVDAEQAHDPVRDLVEKKRERRAHDLEHMQRPRQQSGRAVGVGDRDHLRHLLADRDVQRGRDHERDRKCGGRRGGAVTDHRLDQVGDRRFAEKADPDRGERDPDLAGGERLVDRLDLLQRLHGAGLALLGQRLDPAALAAYQRKLGGDEEPVEDNEQEQEDEEDRGHCSGEPSRARVIRGSSSYIEDGAKVPTTVVLNVA
jgi:hypothetical protein